MLRPSTVPTKSPSKNPLVRNPVVKTLANRNTKVALQGKGIDVVNTKSVGMSDAIGRDCSGKSSGSSKGKEKVDNERNIPDRVEEGIHIGTSREAESSDDSLDENWLEGSGEIMKSTSSDEQGDDNVDSENTQRICQRLLKFGGTPLLMMQRQWKLRHAHFMDM
ncbi:hypothetical protein NE237_031502 [Protea cynaroides]|uniref:Uncharacterized protein n=1 Tax=Protea cynaroides TaxID=273540 RepID=A0A9Q0R266_9MAGN|nr:hypothetical protein NE237_031502 [Protea cynaroides]